MIFDTDTQKDILVDALEKYTQNAHFNGNLTDVAAHISGLVTLKNNIVQSAVVPIKTQIAFCRNLQTLAETEKEEKPKLREVKDVEENPTVDELVENAADLIPEDKKEEESEA